MKMFKKLAAVVMAAVMSMAVLTACGGGSGSGASTKLAGILSGGKFWMDVTDIKTKENMVIATNGEKFYIEENRKDESFKAWVQGNTMYAIVDDVAVKGTYKNNFVDIVPTEDNVAKIKVSKYTVNGVEYYAEIIENGDEKTIYCFNGDKAVYYVEKDNHGETIYAINKLTGSFDSSKLDPPSDMTFIDAGTLS